MKPVYKCPCDHGKTNVMDMSDKGLKQEHAIPIYHRKGPGSYHSPKAKITSRKRGL